ncbi:MAG: uroporphyrinogen-III C-methyltransferase [Zoogloeaceae bacterium]|nr:uroporphyrinogen-III C-methyltransferase [Zoogloeaceae bacterium]
MTSSPRSLPLRPGARPGHVYLVGAGPGDPELLTLRALRLMEAADVAVYDNLIGPQILDLVAPSAQRIYVGKKRADHSVPQPEIGELLVSLAQTGLCVVRLKGGDPYIFGRGGEEAESLAAAGVPFEVVPGITAAAGVGAYSGIPLTHRAFAQSVVFTSAYLKDGALDLDWPALTRGGQTVVFYMGLSRLETLCEDLIRHGLPASTPAAVVRHGTLPDQQVVSGDLATLAAAVRAAGLQPPALVVVGDVVSLQSRFGWFQGGASL